MHSHTMGNRSCRFEDETDQDIGEVCEALCNLNESQMATKPTSPATHIPNFFPTTMKPLNPGHDISLNPDPPVLDLCVRKPTVSPNYPHDYRYNNQAPVYIDPCSSPTSQSGLSENSDASSLEGRDLISNSPSHKMKPSRPFKAYPKVPVPLTFIATTPDIPIMDSSGAYAEFREKMLSQVRATHNGTNKNMRRTQPHNPHITDPTYWEKRKKNNEAAKRSRDARRAKEDEIAVRCSFLEQENLQLKIQVAALKESLRLKSMGWQR